MKRLFAVPFLLLAVAWLAIPSAPPASSQSIPLKYIVQSLPAQVKDVPLEIKGGDPVTVIRSLPFEVVAPAGEPGKSIFAWRLPLGLQGEYNLFSNICKVTYAAKGEYTVQVDVAVWTKDGFVGSSGNIKVVIGETLPGPTPPGPVPPGPIPPDPKPPGPVTGLRVIFITETADESKYPSGQIAAMNSVKVKEYLDAKCQGGAKGWARFDKDQDVSKYPEPWPKMWEAIKPQIGKLPQVAIVTDQSGEIFPVPNSVEEMLAILKKYGG